jgi:hypothetical protein
MTKENKPENINAPLKRSFALEARRTSKGIELVLCPVVGIEKLSDTEIKLKCHSGKVNVQGKRLTVGVLEGGAVEIIGKVEDISFGYGKG